MTIINLNEVRVTKPSLAKLGKLCTPNFSAGEADEKEASKVAQKSGTGLVTRTASPDFGKISTNNVQNDTSEECTASLTGETFCPNIEQKPLSNYPFFIDWISIYQVHQSELPIICAGMVQSYNEHGELEWVTQKKHVLEGSHSSKVMINCDGSKITLSGNLSRFNRPDSLFGYSLDDTLRLANEILSKLGLPPFSAGRSYLMQSTDMVQWTGAVITRLDLTCNYACGSEQNARDFMAWAATQQDSRIKTGVYGDNATVDYGRGSKRLYHKIYNKYTQLLKQKDIDQTVLDYVRLNGIVRHEITLKSRFLADQGLNFLGLCTMNKLHRIYEEKAELIKRQSAEKDNFDDLPKRLRLTVRDYLAGMDLKTTMSRTCFYQHRKELLDYGIDIAIPSKVTQFQPKVKVIIAQPVSAPDWYWQRSA